MKPLIIGIAGGTGSGKTTLVNRLIEQFGEDISVLPHDNYYAEHHDLTLEERQTLNYDHPASFDTDRMIQDLQDLRNGKVIHVFEPLILPAAKDEGSEDPIAPMNPPFFIKKRGANACAVQTAEGFIVLAGSVIRRDPFPSCPNSALSAREQYAQIIDEKMTLSKNIPFKTPSGAAAFVLGRSANGNAEWKTAQGITFGNYESTGS